MKYPQASQQLFNKYCSRLEKISIIWALIKYGISRPHPLLLPWTGQKLKLTYAWSLRVRRDTLTCAFPQHAPAVQGRAGAGVRSLSLALTFGEFYLSADLF